MKTATLPRALATVRTPAYPAAHPPALRALTRLFKSLADPHRLRILQLLADRGEMHVSAIADELAQSQPAVSHHLMQLKHAGLIDYRRDGKFNFYRLSGEGVEDLTALLFPEGPAKFTLGAIEVSIKARK